MSYSRADNFNLERLPDDHFSKKHAITNNRQAQARNDVVKSANTLSVFATFLANAQQALLSLWWVKYINAPLAIATSLFTSILSIRQAYLKKDSHSVAKAVVEVLAGAAMIVGAIAVAASIAALAFVGPLLLIASVGVKAVFDLGSAFVFAIKAATTKDDDLKNVYKAQAKESLRNGIIGGVVTAAAVTLMLVAAPVVQTVVASLAIAATAIGIIASFVNSSKRLAHNRTSTEIHSGYVDVEKSSSCCIGRKLGHTFQSKQDLEPGEQPDLLIDPPAYTSTDTPENTLGGNDTTPIISYK